MDRKAAIYALFDALGIEYSITEHPPMFTQADNEKHRLNIGAVIFKNLFLRNADRSRYYLLSLPLTKRATPRSSIKPTLTSQSASVC